MGETIDIRYLGMVIKEDEPFEDGPHLDFFRKQIAKIHGFRPDQIHFELQGRTLQPYCTLDQPIEMIEMDVKVDWGPPADG